MQSTRVGIREFRKNLSSYLESETHASFESLARQRLIHRDQDDWPIAAAALSLHRPIWTEDTDFFGCGVGKKALSTGHLP